MPELPEVESARLVLERAALRRRIADVDDTDTYECRPHAPGEIRSALVGRRLTAAHRRGKSIWVETSGVGRSRTPGPVLGVHLGMSGRVYVSPPGGRAGPDEEGGDHLGSNGRAETSQPRWDRFTLDFEDGGTLRFLDKRRLGRVRLDPDIEALGPDAGEVGPAELRALLGRSAAPVKARLLDQHAVAGIGNLLADQVLWQARIDPRQPADDLSRDAVGRLHRALRSSIRSAIEHGGVHTLEVVAHRGRDRHCPRCGAVMQRATVGGRTTWLCSVEQVASHVSEPGQ